MLSTKNVIAAQLICKKEILETTFLLMAIIMEASLPSFLVEGECLRIRDIFVFLILMKILVTRLTKTATGMKAVKISL